MLNNFPSSTYWLLLIGGISFSSCIGPRNFYSATPFVSPSPIEKGKASVELFNGSNSTNHTLLITTDTKDHTLGGRTYYMPNDHWKYFAEGFLSQAHSTVFTALPSYSAFPYNAGFDSSNIKTKNWTAGIGTQYFARRGKTIPSLAFSIDVQHLDLNEHGLANSVDYSRFYESNQLVISLQQGFCRKISNSVNLGFVVRAQWLQTLHIKDDYTIQESFSNGLARPGGHSLSLGIFNFYADVKPFKSVPLRLSGQFFNQMIFWNKTLAKYEDGRQYIKGTGAAFSLQYVF